MRTNVGQTALTRTPVPASSLATARVSPTAACLEAVYALVYGAPIRPAIEATVTIDAAPPRAHPGHHRAHAQERPGDVDVEVPRPRRQRRLGQRRALRHAGVVDQHVDGADLGEDSRTAPSSVTSQTAERTPAGSRSSAAGVAPQRHHLVPERSKPLDDRQPDPLAPVTTPSTHDQLASSRDQHRHQPLHLRQPFRVAPDQELQRHVAYAHLGEPLQRLRHLLGRPAQPVRLLLDGAIRDLN